MDKINEFDSTTLIDINNKLGLPRKYSFNIITRLVILTFAFLVIGYVAYLLLYKVGVTADATTFAKVVPFIIMFTALNTVLQNLFNIHSLTLTKEHMEATSLVGIKKIIKWKNINKITMSKSKKRYIIISYIDDKMQQKQYNLMLVFKNMMEIINSIAELAPNAKYDEFMQTIVVSMSPDRKPKESNNEK
ncbi:MAG: hypothetical protein B6226_06135 [Candidatus Cloacimonetes bacterium 4572_65]|nr:MAG: hypothetical protein B6226_06135 [Candidatus Cloacimonetes bacterium 4572_65]